VRLSGVQAGDRVLDCATGTGDLALAFQRDVGPTGFVVGTDFCGPMLAPAPAKAAAALKRFEALRQEATLVDITPGLLGDLPRLDQPPGLTGLDRRPAHRRSHRGRDAHLPRRPIRERHAVDQAESCDASRIFGRGPLRNAAAQRSGAVDRVITAGNHPKRVVLLTATPVNNSLWDLYYLLAYFLKQDAALSELGLRSLREKFGDAVKQDPDDLSPDALFDILDASTVRRTRHFVRRYYPNDRVRDSRGHEIPDQFPTPHVEAITYSLDDELLGFFDEFKVALAPEEGEPLLTLARYGSGQYRRGAAPDPSEAALIGLLRSALLQRFESFGHAFAATSEKLARGHVAFP